MRDILAFWRQRDRLVIIDDHGSIWEFAVAHDGPTIRRIGLLPETVLRDLAGAGP